MADNWKDAFKASLVESFDGTNAKMADAFGVKVDELREDLAGRYREAIADCSAKLKELRLPKPGKRDDKAIAIYEAMMDGYLVKITKNR